MGFFRNSNSNSASNSDSDNQFFEDRFTEIKAHRDAGDVDGFARAVVNTVAESGYSGPDANDKTYSALSAAAKRLRNR